MCVLCSVIVQCKPYPFIYPTFLWFKWVQANSRVKKIKYIQFKTHFLLDFGDSSNRFLSTIKYLINRVLKFPTRSLRERKSQSNGKRDDECKNPCENVCWLPNIIPFLYYFVSLNSHSSQKMFFCDWWIAKEKKSQIFHAKSIFHLIFEEFIQFVHLYFEIMLFGFSIESLAVRTASTSISNSEIETISFSREDLKIAIAHKFFSFRRCFFLPFGSWKITTSFVRVYFALFWFLFFIYLLQLSPLRPRTVFAFLLYKNSRNDCFGGIKCAVLKCSNASIVSAPWFTIFNCSSNAFFGLFSF